MSIGTRQIPVESHYDVARRGLNHPLEPGSQLAGHQVRLGQAQGFAILALVDALEALHETAKAIAHDVRILANQGDVL